MSITILNALQRAILASLLILTIAACTDEASSLQQQRERTESQGFINFGG